jgi:hypothetical protein
MYDQTDTRVYTPLSHLRILEPAARKLSFLPRQPVRSVLSGRNASRLRGRGLSFEELRNYLPGDDIRTIDWKVTARTGSPYVRVYTEERDRPSYLLVDQRMSMFFGSTLNMKSVTAAEAAAITAIRILDQGDRVGGIVFDDNEVVEIPAKRSRRSLDRFLTVIAEKNLALSADQKKVAQPLHLNRPLESLAKIVTHNHLVIVYSDFDQVDDRCFMVCLPAGPGSADDQPIARAEVSPDKVVVGSEVTLSITVLVPTWFLKPPVYPSVEMEGVVTVSPSESSYNITEAYAFPGALFRVLFRDLRTAYLGIPGWKRRIGSDLSKARDPKHSSALLALEASLYGPSARKASSGLVLRGKLVSELFTIRSRIRAKQRLGDTGVGCLNPI